MDVNEGFRRTTQALTASISSHRILIYTALSALAVSAAVANALRNYSNFYSVAIYLSKSSRSVLIVANFSVVVTLFCGHITQQIFFGALRPLEIERLYDRLWFFITESLLAFTIFRDEFDIPFAMMFGFLLFVKSFHWLASDRVEWMEQRPYPGPPGLFHVRMSSLFLILWVTDLIMFLVAVESTLVNGIGGMVLFASEYAILMASVLNATAKYLLSVYDLRLAGQRGGENAPQWENKSMWVFYIELATDFLKLTTYLVFFALIMTFYGLPLNIIRDVYVTARSFVSRIRQLHRYQTATKNMDERYPNATEAEMLAMSDRTCIICREEMIARPVVVPTPTVPAQPEPAQLPEGRVPVDGPNTTPKKLPCGHIFHFHCLRSWLERQQSCPTCRRTVLEEPTPARPPRAVVPGDQPRRAGGANNGIFGRVFGGLANNAPIVPGQFAPGQINQNPNANANVPLNLAGVQPQAVIIQYHIRYDVGRAQVPQPPAQAAPLPLQPAPQFRGFNGPGGAWQPWGMDRRWFEEQIPQPEATSSNAASNTNSNATPSTSNPSISSNSEAGAVSNSNVASASSAAASSNAAEGVSSPQDSNPESSTPGQAAALAALRRVGSKPTSTASTSTTSTASTSTISTASTLTSSSDTKAEVNNNTTSSTTADHFTVPLMIPNLEYTTRNNASNQPQVVRGALRPSRMQRPISQLLPTMTEDQLTAMDRLTRESIDERLRVLEGVSGAVYRCIDELMRLRSALPQAPANNRPVVPPAEPAAATIPTSSSGTAPEPAELAPFPTNIGEIAEQVHAGISQAGVRREDIAISQPAFATLPTENVALTPSHMVLVPDPTIDGTLVLESTATQSETVLESTATQPEIILESTATQPETVLETTATQPEISTEDSETEDNI